MRACAAAPAAKLKFPVPPRWDKAKWDKVRNRVDRV